MKIKYVATTFRPDICSPIQPIISEVNNPSTEEFRKLKKIFHYCEGTLSRIILVGLDHKSIRLIPFIYALFGNVGDISP